MHRFFGLPLLKFTHSIPRRPKKHKREFSAVSIGVVSKSTLADSVHRRAGRRCRGGRMIDRSPRTRELSVSQVTSAVDQAMRQAA
jgi:hypothetical protein